MTASRGRPGLPNLVIAGVTKAGTTALFHHLVQHPDVGGERRKEWQYFAPLRFDPDAELASLRSYRAQFSHCRDLPVRVESSPAYLPGGRPLAQRMAEVLAGPQVVVCLRDPVERVWSGYRMKRAAGHLPPHSFAAFVDEAIRHEEAGLPGTGPGDLHRTVATGRYADHLPGWFEVFGGDLRIVFHEHFRTRPAELVAELHTWAGVDPLPSDDLVLGQHNAARTPRRALVHAAALTANRHLGVGLRAVPAVRQRLLRAYDRFNTEPVDEGFPLDQRVRLEVLYARDTQRLAGLLAAHGVVDVPPWLAVHG